MEYLVVAQENSDNFLATVPLDNTNFIQLVESIYKKRQEFMGRNTSGLPSLSNVSSEPPSAAPSSISTVSNVANSDEPGTVPVVRGTAQNPQLPENVLDTVEASKPPAEKVDTSDHGSNCVCKDCRVKKIGKGSLFPDL